MSLVRKTLKEAGQYAEVVLKAGLVPYVAGSPGLGKSAMFAAICRKYNLKMIDIRLAQEDPTCINGFPDLSNGRSSYLPPERFPLAGIDELPLKEEHTSKRFAYEELIEKAKEMPDNTLVKADLEQFQAQYCYAGWLVFFDELPSAPRATQAAAYKILLDRMIDNYKIHPKCGLAAAGNLMDDDAIVNEIGTALRSRLIHIHVETHAEDYISYISKSGFDLRIVSYLAFKKSNVNNFKQFLQDSSDETFCCERTWDFASRILNQCSPKQDAPVDEFYTDLLCGTLGSTAIEFVQYTHAFKDLPTIQEIISNPAGTAIPDRPAIKYLLMGMLVANADDKTIDPIMDYMSRFEKDFGFIFGKMLWAKADAFLDNPKVEALFDEIADMMLA